MGKTILFLKKCYNTPMYSEGETYKDAFGKNICIIGILLFAVLVYGVWAWFGIIFVEDIVKMLLLNYQQWIWVFYGLIIGLFGSVIFQSIPKTGRKPKEILGSLFHHYIFFGDFIIIILIIWVIVRIGWFFGIIKMA